MSVSNEIAGTRSVGDWFKRRTYRHGRFDDLAALGERKRESGLSLTVVLPAQSCAETIGPTVEGILSLNESQHLVDQLLVVDAASDDGTADIAANCGAEVFDENDLLAGFGPTIGKGDAMWRALSVAEGDLVAFIDSDTVGFDRHFVSGLLGPMLDDRSLQFVKATYGRPFHGPDGVRVDDAGRVTELMAKPMLNVFFPELCGFAQPLAGEVIATRELLHSIPFATGYAIETAMLIDVFERVGLEAMGQSDLGTRDNSFQPLFDLGPMAYAVARAVLMRTGVEGAAGLADDADRYLHAFCPPGGPELRERTVEIVERPALRELQ